MIRFSRTTVFAASLIASSHAAEISVLFIAGPKGQSTGEHDHPAVATLLASHLESSGLPIQVDINAGWPADEAKTATASTVVLISDGGDAHAAKGRLDALAKRHATGKGLVVLHGALEPADAAMGGFFDQAIGGRFEPDTSVRTIWKMQSPALATHPATRGVEPFELEDELSFNLRLRDGIAPLLQAIPPLGLKNSGNPGSGSPAGNEASEARPPQTLAWVFEHSTGARGFGFSGCRYDRSWSNENLRKLVLNAIVWTAGGEVPETGVKGKAAETPIYQTIDEAIAKGDLTDVKRHLAANPESLLKGGKPTSRTPLEQAVMRNKTEIALHLISAGADPNTANASKRTPLHLAIDRNNPEIIAALMKAGAKPDVLDSTGWTPLHYAGAKNQLETAKALLAGGANPMTLSELGGTPLHEAAASGGPELIKLLLEHKVDPSIKSKQGVTALDLAIEYKNEGVIGILKGLEKGN